MEKPFDALKALKGKVRSHDGKPAGKKPAAPGRPAAAPATEDNDLQLFQAAVAGAKPLAADNHADLGRPKPKPVPRPKVVEPEPEQASAPRAAPPDPSDPAALFRAMMGDVQPIKDTGRADVGRRLPRHRMPMDRPTAAQLVTASDGLPILSSELPDDPAALFRLAVGDAAPLKDSGRAEANTPPPLPHPRKREEDEHAVLQETLDAPLTFEDRLDMGEEAAFLRTGLPRRVLTDLRRGRWVVQGELDLHGMTRDEARAALAQFIAASLQQGRRCIRLIHGRGHGSPGRIPILKHLSRGWLAQREDILAFCQARPHEGGEGALLILLRSGRPNTEMGR